MATVRCPHCQKRLADASWALKAHAWAKPACRVSVPESMRLEIEEEERQQPSDTSAFHCPGCGKSLANGGEALKAHAWSRAQCRRRIPAEMRAEIEEEEAEAEQTRCEECPGCGRKLANGCDALLNHAWMKRECRWALPAALKQKLRSWEEEGVGDIAVEEPQPQKGDRGDYMCPLCRKRAHPGADDLLGLIEHLREYHNVAEVAVPAVLNLAKWDSHGARA